MLDKAEYDGIKVTTIKIRNSNKDSFLVRLFGFVFYAMIASWMAVFRKTDVVIASSGPIFVGVPGLLAKWIRRRKLITWSGLLMKIAQSRRRSAHLRERAIRNLVPKCILACCDLELRNEPEELPFEVILLQLHPATRSVPAAVV